MKTKRILVATDFSSAADVAARRAVRIAKACGATLELVHVLRLPPLKDARLMLFERGHITEASLSTGIASRLEAVANQLAEHGDVIPETCVLVGKPAVVLAKWASDSRADLVVVGAHGENLLLDIFVGATVLKLVRLTTTPVLVVKQGRFSDYERVLIATDFSPAARAAAELVARLLPTAELYLFHAYEAQFEREMYYAGCAPDTVDHYRMLSEVEARSQMRQFISSLAAPARYFGTVRHGNASAQIVEQAKNQRVELLVLGAHRQSNVAATILGSVAARLINESPVDLLLVPSINDQPGQS